MNIREYAEKAKKEIAKKERSGWYEQQETKRKAQNAEKKEKTIKAMKEDVVKNTSSGTANWFGTGLWDKGNELYKLAVEKAERERIDNQVNSAESNARKRQPIQQKYQFYNTPEFQQRSGYEGKNIKGADAVVAGKEKDKYFMINTDDETYNLLTKSHKDSLERDHNYRYMTADQKKIYNYLYNTQGEKRAEEYFKTIEDDLNKQVYDTEIEYNEWVGKEHPVLGTVKNYAGMKIEPFVGAVGIAKDIISGDVDGYDEWHRIADERAALSKGVKENIDSDTGKWLYDAGMTIADMVGTQGTGKMIGKALGSSKYVNKIIAGLYASRSASQGIAEAKRNGKSNIESLGIGMARAGIEYLTEKWSLDRWFGDPSRSLIATIIKSATFEGLEEVASNWGNRVLDVFAYGDKNAISQTYKNFRGNGYSEGDSAFQTFLTLVGEDLQTFAISAFSGGFVGGGGYLTNAMGVGGINNYKRMYDEKLEDKGISKEKYSVGYTTDNKRVVIIDDNILDGVSKENYVAKAKEAISKFKPQIPISGRLIKVTRKTGNEYTNSKNANWLKHNDNVKYVDKLNAAGHLDEILIASTNYINEDLEHERNDNIKEFARGEVLMQIGDNKYDARVIVGFTESNEMVLYDVVDINDVDFSLKRQQTEHISERSPGTTSRRNEQSTVDNRISQTEPIVKREDTVEIKPDGKSSEIAVGLIVDGWGENGRVGFNSSFDLEVNNNGFKGTKAEYMRNYNLFYVQGLNGGKISNVPSQYADRISMSARKAAYEAGKADRKINLDKQYEQANRAVVKDGGLIRNHNSHELSADVNNMIDKIGKMFGVTVEIKDKVYNKAGKEVNGKYSNGEIELSYDKIKNDTLEEMAARLIRHEITHRIQELAPKQYDQFRKLAYDYAQKHYNDSSLSLAEKMAENRNLDLNDAIDEVIADLMGVDKFALEIARKDLTLAQKIKGIIKDLLDVTGLRKYSEIERIERAWEKAVEQAKKQAKKNSSKSRTVENLGVEKYSFDGITKSGIRKYISDFPEGMSENEKVKVFKSRIATIFNLGAVSLKTDTKRIEIKGDKFTATKNMHGDEKGSPQEMSAKINSLYDLADILETSTFVKSEIEESYKYSNISPKNKAHKNVKYWYKFKNRIYLDDVLYDVTFNIRDKGKEQYQYLIEFNEHNKKMTQSSHTTSKRSPANITESPYDNTLSYNKDIVNTNNMQNSEKNSEGDMDELFQVRQERDEAIKKAEYYKSQLKRTKPFTPDEKSIKSLVKKIAKDYDGGKNLGAEFRELYTLINRYMSYAREKTADPIIAAANWENVTDKVKDLGMEIVKNTIVQNDEASKKFDTIKKIIKGYNIRFPEEYRGDFDSVGGSMAFRRKNLNRINIRKEGTPVDVVYDELNQMFGDLFPDEITHPVDQLLYLDEFLDRTGVVFENPYNNDLDDAAEYMSSEIFEGLLSVDAAKPTVVDKMAEDADRRVEEIRQKKQKAIDRITEQHKKALLEIEGLKAERSKAWKERSRAKSEGQLDLQSRRELMRLMNKVKRMLKKSRAKIEIDSDKRLLLNELDLESVRLTGKKLENLEDLKKYYETMKAKANFVKDVGIEKKLEVLSKKHLAIMSTAEKTEYLRLKQRFESCEKLSEAELERLADLMVEADKELSMSDIRDLIQYFQYIEHQIRTADYMINSEDKRNVYVQGESVIEDIRNSGGIKKYGVGNFINHYLSGTLSPIRFVRRITGWCDSALEKAFQALQKGEVKMQDYQMRANRIFDKWVHNKEFMSRISGKDAEFEKFSVAQYDRQGAYIGTKDIEITRGMMISLYLHNMNYSNQRHMTYGGVTIPDKVLYQKGKFEEAYNSGTEVYLNPREIKKITNKLTSEELNYANDVYNYFNEFSKKEINTVSAELYGYDKAGVENYFPIYTNKAFLQTDFESIVYDGSLENIGFMKERQGRATPIMLDDVTSVLDRSIKLHSRFVGLAVPVRNMNRLMAVSTSKTTQTYKRNEYGQLIGVSGNVINDIEFQEPQMQWGIKEGFTGSVMKEIQDKWGEPAKKYIENMMSDLQGGRPKNENGLTKAFNKLYGNIMSAQLSLKIHIAFNQAASYFVAAPDVGWKALMRALPDMGRVDLNLIARYTPLQWSRNNGEFDPTMFDIMKGKQGLVKKALNSKYLNFMAHSDALVTRKLWKAAEYNIRDNRKDLKFGTDEYYEAVAELYEKTILNSQPNSMTMERPEFLRSDSFTKFMFPFQGETMKNTNMIYDALGELQAKKKQFEQAKGTENERKAKKSYEDAQKNAWRTMSSQLVSGIVFSVVVGAAKIGFGGEKERRKYEDEEGKIAVNSILKKMGTDFFENTFFQAPGTGEVYDIIKCIVTKEKYYGGGIIALDTLYDVGGAVINLFGDIQKLYNGDSSVEQCMQTVRGAIHTASIIFGIPSRAIENYATSIAGWVIEGTTDNKIIARYKREHLINVLTTKTTDEDGNATIKATSPVYDILYSAFSKGDKEAYDYIIYDLLKKGVSPENVESAINSRKNKDESFDYSQSLGMYSGISQSVDYEEYKKYIEDAEEVGISENDLKEGIGLINSGKAYKQMIKNIEEFVESKNYYQNQKDFFIELAQKKYSITELTNEQYLQYCSERDTISTELLNDMNFNIDNMSANALYSKVLKYSEAVALENASDREYVIKTTWINEAKNSLNNLHISTGEFMQLYGEYGQAVYSDKAKETAKKGFSVKNYLEFKEKISGVNAKDENGKSVSGLKKKRIKGIVQKMNISEKEKEYLFSLIYSKG